MNDFDRKEIFLARSEKSFKLKTDCMIVDDSLPEEEDVVLR